MYKNSSLSVGILFLNEPAFQESRQYFLDLGFQVRILEAGYPNPKIDFFHMPDYKGFDTLSLGFRGYQIPPEFPPCSNEVRHFFEHSTGYDYYLNKSIPVVAFGHPFYMVASQLKDGNTPLFKLEMREGAIRFVTPVNPMARHDDTGVIMLNRRLIGGEHFNLTEEMIEYMHRNCQDSMPIEITQLY